jgi:hypothetical protein
MENTEVNLNSENIGKMWKKSRLISAKIWKCIRKVG